MKQVFLILLAACIFGLYTTSAQPGLQEMQEARSFVRHSFFSMQDFSYILAGLIAIFGSVRVFHKWQMGKEITEDLSAWFFSALFILLMGSFLSQLFGI